MKALIYLLFITTTTLSLMSQRIQEPLVELSKPDYTVRTETTIKTVGGCFGHVGNFESSFYKLSSTSMDVDAYKTFGILTPSFEPVFGQTEIVNNTNEPSVITITQTDIKKIPAIMGDADINEALNVTGIVNCDDRCSLPTSSNATEHCDKCICIILGGIPVRYGDIINREPATENTNNMGGCECKCHSHKNTLETTETMENEPTVVTSYENLSVMDDESDRSTQGPFTGLEGHNFTEEPAIIYPNPVKDILHVKSTDPITVIEILNIHGEVERVLYINETMDISELAAGNYFARIHFENIKDVQIEKIIIVK